MSYERMLDKEYEPTEDEVFAYLGREAVEAWQDVTAFIDANYNFTRETTFGGRKYGWAIRYRRSGKSLCTLHPERGAFTILIVLGKKEVEQAVDRLDEFGPDIASLVTGARQYHDGRWLWIRVLNKDNLDDVKRLLLIKKKPQKKKE